MNVLKSCNDLWMRCQRAGQGGMLLLLFLATGFTGAAEIKEGDPRVVRRNPDGPVVVIPMDGAIDPLLGQFFDRRLEEAKELRPSTIIFEINSPGGYLSVMDEMIQGVEALEGIYTVAYVPREALSAAAIFSLSCDAIYLDSEARFGDAGPIVIGEDAAFRHAPEKIKSDLVARVRILADRHGRPAALAEAMVDQNARVYEAIEKQSHRTAYFTADEWESLKDQDQWEKGLPVFETRENSFLEVSGARAAELGLADGVAENQAELLKTLGIDGEMVRMQRTWVDTCIAILSSPLITVILIVIGIIGVVIEIGSPGLGLGGLTAAACFGLFFWSRFLGGTAGWLEVVLLVTGVLFLAAEIFVLPGFGVAGLSGMGLILVALLMAMRHHLMPESDRDFTLLGQQVMMLLAAVVLLLFAALFGGKYLLNLPGVRWLTLVPEHGDAAIAGVRTAMDSSVAGGTTSLASTVQVGDFGVAESPLRPGGRARFGEALVDVLTEGDYIEAGTPLVVVSQSGMRIVVRNA